MSAVLTQEQVKELEDLRKQLMNSLNDYWDSQIFLGDTKALKRFTGNLNSFFKKEVTKIRKGKKK